MLVWRYAAVLPTVQVIAPSTPSVTAVHVVTPVGWYPAASATAITTRSSSTSPAPLLATERNVVTSMLAPSNTSGHQKWNGTAEILNPTPTISPKTATTISGDEEPCITISSASPGP